MTFPDLKFVPLEVKIELWLEREAYSQFSVRRLEISKIYHLRTLSRPCKVMNPLCFNGLDRVNFLKFKTSSVFFKSIKNIGLSTLRGPEGNFAPFEDDVTEN